MTRRDGGGTGELRQAQGHHHERGHAHRDRQSAGAGHEPAHPLAGQDVEAPGDGGDEHQPDAGHVQRLRGAGGTRHEVLHQEQHDPGERQHHPEHVPQTAAQGGGHGERPEELDGHGHAERDAVDRRVEEAVHAREGRTEHQDGAPLGPSPGAQRRPDEGQQHRGGHAHTQHGGAPRAEGREEADGQGGAELQGQAGAEHHEHAHRGAAGTDPAAPARALGHRRKAGCGGGQPVGGAGGSGLGHERDRCGVRTHRNIVASGEAVVRLDTMVSEHRDGPGQDEGKA